MIINIMEDINWVDTFVNKDSIIMTPEIENILKSNKFINNIETKIEEIEIDFLTKMNEIKNTYDNENIETKYSTKNSIEILQKELEIIKLISKYSLQNNKLEFIFIITCLKYLFKLSEILRNRLKQAPINMNKSFNNINKGFNNISRCSYKFCNYKEECTYNYNFNKKTNPCYQDHYVHNMVSHDVDSLINYIENNYKNNSIIMHNKEILKTINTLSFVIGHMEGELKGKCLYNEPSEWEKFHYINNTK
jgi:hypothetical protein